MLFFLPVNSLSLKDLLEKKIIEWLLSNPDLNPIENLWKMKLYEAGKQYNGKADL